MILLRLPLAILRLLVRSVLLALSQIWANKGRSILTTIGIVIGVAAVTAVIAALTGLRTNVLEDFESLGTDTMFVVPHRPDSGPHRYASWRSIRFQPENVEFGTTDLARREYTAGGCRLQPATWSATSFSWWFQVPRALNISGIYFSSRLQPGFSILSLQAFPWIARSVSKYRAHGSRLKPAGKWGGGEDSPCPPAKAGGRQYAG